MIVLSSFISRVGVKQKGKQNVTMTVSSEKCFLPELTGSLYQDDKATTPFLLPRNDKYFDMELALDSISPSMVRSKHG